MELKCKGCGRVQTVDPKLPGFIRADVLKKRSDDFRCERCYNLMHYNRGLEVAIDEAELLAEVRKISGMLCLSASSTYLIWREPFRKTWGLFRRGKNHRRQQIRFVLKSVKKKNFGLFTKIPEGTGIVPEGGHVDVRFQAPDIEGLLSIIPPEGRKRHLFRGHDQCQ